MLYIIWSVIIHAILILMGVFLLAMVVLLVCLLTDNMAWYHIALDKFGLEKMVYHNVPIPKGFYDITKFEFKDLPPLTVGTIRADPYGDVVTLELLINYFNSGAKAKWNRDKCCFEVNFPEDG